MMTPDSRIEATMPCFYCVRCPRESKSSVKVVVPHLSREQCLLVPTARECPADIGPLEVLYQTVCLRRRKQRCYLIEQSWYFVWSSKRQSWYLSDADSELLVLGVLSLHSYCLHFAPYILREVKEAALHHRSRPCILKAVDCSQLKVHQHLSGLSLGTKQLDLFPHSRVGCLRLIGQQVTILH